MIGVIATKRKVRSAFDSLSLHNLDTFIANWGEDATFIHRSSRSVSGEVQGKEAIEEWFRRFTEHYPISSFTVKNVCVENIFALGGNNVVAVAWDVKLANKDGKEFENSGVTLINVKKGKAALVQDYIFDLEVAKAASGG